MKNAIAITLVAFSLSLAACEDPAANKAKAITSNAASATSTAALMSVVRGEALAIDPDNSKVLFTGSKVTGRHEGGFNKFRGTIDLVNASPSESSVVVEIETASVFTDADGLTKHLLSGDFFDVKNFPRSSFASTKIEPASGDEFNVTGDLELHGQQKSITFPATIKVEGDHVTVDAEFSIDRKDFGILYAGKADNLIRNDVVLKLELKAPRGK